MEKADLDKVREGYRLGREEFETSVLGDGFHKVWDIWTNDPVMVRKFKKQGYELPEGDRWKGYRFVVPFFAVSFRSGKRAKPKITDEQRQNAKDRMKAIHARRQDGISTSASPVRDHGKGKNSSGPMAEYPLEGEIGKSACLTKGNGVETDFSDL